MSDPRLPSRCPECRAEYTLRGVIFDYGTPIESRKLECTNCEYIWFVPNSASESDVERMLQMYHIGGMVDAVEKLMEEM